MTFASHDFRSTSGSCDCDECGVNVHIPPPILAALRERKRQKLEQGPIKRTQVRSLVKRGPDNVALWQWVLPQGAEPLVEFGSSHRIIWVHRLPGRNILRSVGKGIIGSSDEQKSRTYLDWHEDGVYLLPSSGGKAVGWTHQFHSSPDGEESIAKSDGRAELHIAKVPSDRLKDVRFLDDDKASLPVWVTILMRLCREGIETLGEPKASDRHAWHKYDEEDSTKIKEAFALASNPIDDKSKTEARLVPDPENPTKLVEGNQENHL